jgi:hypothetical protein
MGHTPNIAALYTYSFYDYCWYWNSEEGFPEQQRVLGHWLGVAHNIGGPLTYFVGSETRGGWDSCRCCALQPHLGYS